MSPHPLSLNSDRRGVGVGGMSLTTPQARPDAVALLKLPPAGDSMEGTSCPLPHVLLSATPPPQGASLVCSQA